MAEADVLVTAVSCQAHEDRARACAATWMPRLHQDHGVRSLFVVGDPQLEADSHYDEERRVLTLRVPDTYEALATKSQALFAWVLEHTSHAYVFKCDDDTYIHDRTFVAVDPAGYLGLPLTTPAEPGLRYASGGSGYLLDRRAMRIVVDDPTVPECEWEDVAVGRSLARAGVALTAMPEYRVDPAARARAGRLGSLVIPCGADLRLRATHHLQRAPARSMLLFHTLARALTDRPASPASQRSILAAVAAAVDHEGVLLVEGTVCERAGQRWLLAGRGWSRLPGLSPTLREHGWFVSSDRALLWLDGRGLALPLGPHDSCPASHGVARPLSGAVLLADPGPSAPAGRSATLSTQDALAALRPLTRSTTAAHDEQLNRLVAGTPVVRVAGLPEALAYLLERSVGS